MRVQLTQALFIEGKHYPLGIQEISEEKLKHKHFHHYIKLGYVIDAEAVPEVKVETAQERGARLAEKLHAAKKPAAPAPQAEEVGGEEVADVSEDSEQSEVSEKESSKKKKHKR